MTRLGARRPIASVSLAAFLVTALFPSGSATAGSASFNLGPQDAPAVAAPLACAAVTIKTAELVSRDGVILLKVTGEAPSAGLTFAVRPVVYIMQPDYWLMALVGCVPKGSATASVPTPFSAEVSLAGSVGRFGIDLTGDPFGTPLRLKLPA